MYVSEDGLLHKVKDGADSVLPFSKGTEIYTGTSSGSTISGLGTQPTVSFSFSMAFPEVPKLYIQPYDISAGNCVGIKSIASVTTTGFKVKYTIGSNGTYYPKVKWLAYL